MRILVLHQYLLSEGEGGVSRWNDLAQCLTEKGNEVTVIASTVSYLSGRKPEKYKGRFIVRERVGKVTVVRTFATTEYRRTFVWRLLSMLSFMVSAVVAGLMTPRPHVIVASSPPLTVGISGYLLSCLLLCPLVFEARDLWPQVVIELGVLRNGFVIALARRIEHFLYRHARLVCVVTSEAKEYLAKQGVLAEKVFSIPNGALPDRFEQVTPREIVRASLGITEKYVVLYLGAHGPAHQLEQVIKAAEHLRHERDICFALVGDGAQKQWLQREARKRRLTNIHFMSSVPIADVPDICSASDVGLALFKKSPVFSLTYPQKIFDYMAAGLPVILCVDGASRKLVEGAGTGVYCDPDKPALLAETVRSLLFNQRLRHQLGRRGRQLVQREFRRDLLAAEYEQRLKDIRAM